MLGITDITTYVIGVVVIVLLPGPNSMFVLSIAARDGVPRGYQAALGVSFSVRLATAAIH